MPLHRSLYGASQPRGRLYLDRLWWEVGFICISILAIQHTPGYLALLVSTAATPFCTQSDWRLQRGLDPGCYDHRNRLYSHDRKLKVSPVYYSIHIAVCWGSLLRRCFIAPIDAFSWYYPTQQMISLRRLMVHAVWGTHRCRRISVCSVGNRSKKV